MAVAPEQLNEVIVFAARNNTAESRIIPPSRRKMKSIDRSIDEEDVSAS
jgi:hypothetical protein